MRRRSKFALRWDEAELTCRGMSREKMEGEAEILRWRGGDPDSYAATLMEWKRLIYKALQALNLGGVGVT